MRRGLLLLLAAVMSGVGAASASGEGNVAYSTQCQKGGWTVLRDAGGTAFGNAGDCTSYAAQGGTFYKTVAQVRCESNGGVFSISPRTTVFPPLWDGQRVAWTCNGFSGGQPVWAALIVDCFQEGNLLVIENHVDFTCWKDGEQPSQ